jgi:hypothetical protein
VPIHLTPPAYQPTGPDGQGWNRLSLNAHGSKTPQCALRPRSYATLVESQDTRRAQWGGFGPCSGDGFCRDECLVLAVRSERLRSFTSDVLVRLLPRGEGVPDQAHLMNHPEKGWDSSSQVWTWEELARLEGWRVGRPHRDEHGDGFWLHATADPVNGCYGSTT